MKEKLEVLELHLAFMDQSVRSNTFETASKINDVTMSVTHVDERLVDVADGLADVRETVRDVVDDIENLSRRVEDTTEDILHISLLRDKSQAYLEKAESQLIPLDELKKHFMDQIEEMRREHAEDLETVRADYENVLSLTSTVSQLELEEKQAEIKRLRERLMVEDENREKDSMGILADVQERTRRLEEKLSSSSPATVEDALTEIKGVNNLVATIFNRVKELQEQVVLHSLGMVSSSSIVIRPQSNLNRQLGCCSIRRN